MTDNKRSLEEMESDIAETRGEIGDDLDELKSRLSRENLKRQAQDRLRDTRDSAVTAVRDAGRKARDSAMNTVQDAGRKVKERTMQMRSDLSETARENRQTVLSLGAGLVAAGLSLILVGLRDRQRGIRVNESVTIARPRWELYAFWHQLENLPRFMKHLASVDNLGGARSHWVASGPSGSRVAWDAEIIADRENELIAWRSLPGADVTNAGWVRFRDVPGGSEVTASLVYKPPGGRLGAAVAGLFGEEPHQQIRDDLHHLKWMMERGGTPAQDWRGRSSLPEYY